MGRIENVKLQKIKNKIKTLSLNIFHKLQFRSKAENHYIFIRILLRVVNFYVEMKKNWDKGGRRKMRIKFS
jgi:hypothetical protein